MWEKGKSSCLGLFVWAVLVPLATSTTWGLGGGAARTDGPDPDGIAVVIGNRHYAHNDVPDVHYAHRDAHLHFAAQFDGVNII